MTGGWTLDFRIAFCLGLGGFLLSQNQSVAFASDNEVFFQSALAEPGPKVLETLFGRECSVVVQMTDNLNKKRVFKWAKKILLSRGYDVKDPGTAISDAEFGLFLQFQPYDLSAKSGGKVTANLTHAEAATPDRVVPYYREQKTGGALKWSSKSKLKDLMIDIPQCVVLSPGTTPPSEMDQSQ